MQMFRISSSMILIALVAAICLSGCGVMSPAVQEAWGTPDDAAFIKQQLMDQASCELRQAIHKRYHANPFHYGFLKGWIATIELITDIDEKTSVTPAVSFSDPLPNVTTIFTAGRSTSTPQSYALGFGATLSSEGHAIDKLFLTYKVDDFINIRTFDRTCLPEQNHASLFVRTPLELEVWLKSSVSVAVAEGPDSQVEALGRFPRAGGGIPAVLSHDITFEIVTNGSITPAWKLVRVGTGTNPLAMTSRDRKQELIITMSPADPANPSQLGPLGIGSVISSDNAATIRRVSQ